jgi:hypothetical protein
MLNMARENLKVYQGKPLRDFGFGNSDLGIGIGDFS